MSSFDPIWDEFGKIDYLLDQLARAVERGDVELAAYDHLAPRYLERRAELAEIIERRRARDTIASGQATPIAGPAAVVPAAERLPVAASAAAERADERAAHRESAVAAPVMRAARPSISAGAWMTYAGAFLVVVAVAIFTIYAWGSMSPFAKLAVLALVTALFYAGGGVVRTKLELPAVGVALIGVGSAMLLFDGWAVINGFGLHGALPWAVLLLACSLAYWFTEVRIAGGWFGAVGAASQIGWWWLLTQAMGFGLHWRLAGVAIVAALWTLAGERVGPEGPLAVLGAILRRGGVVVAGAATLGMFAAAPYSGDGWVFAGLTAAVVSALACSLVVERSLPEPPGLSAAVHLPVILAAVSLISRGDLGLTGAMVVLMLAYAAFALWRGGALYALLTLVAAAVLAIAVGESFDVRPEVVVGLFATFMAVAALGGRVLRAATEERPARAVARSAGALWEIVGPAGLAFACLVTPLATGTVPLTGSPVDGWHVALAVWILALWSCAAALRSRAAGWVLVAWSFYSAAALAAWAAPQLHSAWYATLLLVLAVAWSQARGRAYVRLGLDATAMSAVCRVLFLAVLVFGVLGSAFFFRVSAYPTAALLLACALAWAGETVRWRTPWAAAPAAVFAVLAAGMAGRVYFGDVATGVAAAAAAVVLAATAAVRARRSGDRWRGYLAIGAALAGSVLSVAALGERDRLALALALLAVAWALAAVAARLPELAGLAALFASFALSSWLAWSDSAPWVTLLAFAALAGALMVPRAIVRSDEGVALRYARILAIAGLLVAGELVLLGSAARVLGVAMGRRWYDLGASGLAFALVVAGVCLAVWSVLERIEAVSYPAWGLLVAGALVQADAMGVRQAEAYLLAIAAYSAAMGVLWARRGAGRRVPFATDAFAFAVGVAAPFVLSLNVLDDAVALEHGLWALGLAGLSTAVGVVTRTRVYFLGGIAVLALEALWLSRSVLLALPTWVWIGLLGLGLIAAGVTFARRELLDSASRRISEGLSDWR